jgi:hypothetical protein
MCGVVPPSPAVLSGFVVINSLSFVEARVPFLGDQHALAISDSNYDPTIEVVIDAS